MTSANANIAHALWDAAARAAMAPAIVERDQAVSFAALARRAGAIGAALIAAGMRTEERVGILLERGADAVASIFGVLAAGGIVVVLDDSLRPLQIEHALADCGAAWLITSAGVLSRLPRPPVVDAQVLSVGALIEGDERVAPVQREATDIAHIVYTSGSTGRPKGVMISHANLRSLAAIVNGYLEISSTDRVGAFLPLSFVYGLGQMFCAVTARAALVVERSPLVTQITATLRESGITVLAGVPSLWTRLLAAPEFRDTPVASLRVLTNAGGALAPSAVQQLRRAQPQARLFLMYGLTEALRCTYLPPEEVDAHPDSMGRPIPASELRLLRDDGSEADVGEPGEIVFRGPTVTMGYWNDPVATGRVFHPNPDRRDNSSECSVFTGDLARRDAQGLLYFVGRKDRMIKTMGHRVAPQEVADALLESAEVADVEIVGEPDAQWGMILVAHVVLRPGGAMARLREYCARELPRHLRPSRYEVHDELPMTSSGKHDLASLAG